MKILVMNQNSAVFLCKEITVPTIVISIVSKDENEVIFDKNKNIIDILHLSFNDLEYDIDNFKAPILDDFNGLKEFLDKYTDENLTILIHCGAGVSRSPAVALAIKDYFKLNYNRDISINIDIEKEAIPNRLVYRTALYALTGYLFGDGFKQDEHKSNY